MNQDLSSDPMFYSLSLTMSALGEEVEEREEKDLLFVESSKGNLGRRRRLIRLIRRERLGEVRMGPSGSSGVDAAAARVGVGWLQCCL